MPDRSFITVSFLTSKQPIGKWERTRWTTRQDERADGNAIDAGVTPRRGRSPERPYLDHGVLHIKYPSKYDPPLFSLPSTFNNKHTERKLEDRTYENTVYLTTNIKKEKSKEKEGIIWSEILFNNKYKESELKENKPARWIFSSF